MMTWMDVERGRWRRIAAVWTGLVIALFLGACETETVSDGTGGPLSGEEVALLAAEVGPDWEVIEEYQKSLEEWTERIVASHEARAADGEKADTTGKEGGESAGTAGEVDGEDAGAAREVDGEDAGTAREVDGEDAGAPGEVDGEDALATPEALEELLEARPVIHRAAAAAIAIIEHDDPHEKRAEAARFLITDVSKEPGGDELAYRGAKALFDGSAEVEGWPMLLFQMDTVRWGFTEEGESPVIDRFFEELASDADDPLHRAAAQYYVASGLRSSLDVPSLSTEERAARRERALDAAEGLSAGVEDESLMLASGIRTFAEAEDDLLSTIRHATVGTTTLEIEGARLDGTAESLSAYRGKVVLLDFWATWCGPCVSALPELRQLVADLPADRFALLAISVDKELETVTDFMESEPMPFAHWHVGMESEAARRLNVKAFPTYILLDEQGKIVARDIGLLSKLRSLIDETVEAATEA